MQLMSKEITSPTETVDVAHLPAGVYMVRIVKEQKVKTVKVILY
jgi:hypothetical protein